MTMNTPTLDTMIELRASGASAAEIAEDTGTSLEVVGRYLPYIDGRIERRQEDADT